MSNPKIMRAVNGWLTLFWVAMIPVSFLTGLAKAVSYVTALSLWALVASHWAVWQASRVEVKQLIIEAEKELEDIPGEVVAAMVEKTSVESAS